MKTALFDFTLPEELIAQTPTPVRSASRLMVLNRIDNSIQHMHFADIANIIPPGDLLVLNRSRVIPARIYIDLPESTKKCEILFVEDLGNGKFTAMVRPGRRFKVGRNFQLPGNITAHIENINPDGLRIIQLEGENNAISYFCRYGEMPLPPYIKSRESPPERYQTVFAKEEGSIAAPTAGLHFDEELLKTLRDKNILIGEIILHVGIGTFKPIETENIEDHIMHSERFFISQELADLFAKTRANKKTIWACGTTSVRALESAIRQDGTLQTGWQTTNCFIKPGYQFRAVDHLITNFHLPRSTLIVLVAAFAGLERIMNAYKTAIAEKYRFFSFGDAMVII